MREMRRKDREVTDEARIDEIISRCNCCRIGFNDSGEVYIVPLNFGYVKQDGRRNCTRGSPPATAPLNSAVLSAMETLR